jgi:hypothetical protein
MLLGRFLNGTGEENNNMAARKIFFLSKIFLIMNYFLDTIATYWYSGASYAKVVGLGVVEGKLFSILG